MKKSKKNPDLLPLELLKQVSQRNPGVWDVMEHFHSSNGAPDLATWPEWCYAPMASAIAYVTQGALGLSFDEIAPLMSEAQAISALAPWRKTKQIYLFDATLEEMLENQDDFHIPSELLLQLQFPAIYIKGHNIQLDGRLADGFFVYLEYDVVRKQKELRLLYLYPDLSVSGVPVNLDTQTLVESVESIRKSAIKVANKAAVGEDSMLGAYAADVLAHSSTDSLRLEIGRALQLVIYLLAVNADVQENAAQKQIYRRPKDSSSIKDKASEIRKWDVGVRVGQTIRAYHVDRSSEAGEAKSKSGTHASPRPHIRRGHWHHYWTGKRADPESRKLILKWTTPMLIGGSSSNDDLPTVIHQVKQ